MCNKVMRPDDQAKFECGALRCQVCALAWRFICPVCGKSGRDHPGSGFQACGVFWHYSCFGCQFCRVSLTKAMWWEVRGRPCCEQCRGKLTGEGKLDRRGRLTPRSVKPDIDPKAEVSSERQPRSGVRSNRPAFTG
jgi:hypothetical protein